MRGIVKWFCTMKGYGFVTGEDQEDYFCHYTGIAGDGYRNLNGDAEVVFDAMEDGKKLKRAINVMEVN